MKCGIFPAALVLLLSAAAGAGSIEVTNNHPFAVKMPFHVDDQTVLVDLPPHGKQNIDLASAAPSGDLLSATPVPNGLSFRYHNQDLGSINFALVLHPIDAAIAKDDAASVGQPRYESQPLKIALASAATHPLFNTFTGTTTSEGLKIDVAIDLYPTGFLDIRSTVTNQSAPQTKIYAALLTQWTQPKIQRRSYDYNNAIASLAAGQTTPWRSPGDRHQFVARGLNWLTSDFPAVSVLWLNPFSPSFTIDHAAKGKTAAHWVGANSAQLAEEAFVKDDSLTFVTELAHGNIKFYRSRLDDYTLPDPSQPLAITHRLVFSDKPFSNDDAAHAFVALTSCNLHTSSTLSLGAPSVTFGTAYFPYSTLGENFITQHLPGMSQDSYWPLAADIVKNYKLFADDIRTDLCIAKAMGFESLRLHHLEMLYTDDKSAVKVTPEERTAFLDFFFAELKKLNITALIDIKIKPAELAELVTRYRDQIDGVEIDNEVLIFGIPNDDIQYWKDCYAVVKQVAPNIPVHWTAHTNTAAFARLKSLGVPFDRIGQHAYMDGASAIPLSRDFALQVANYASMINKPPVITEWNWRFLTRLTPENRAKIYAPIFENVLASGAVPEIYQFQFQDSLAMNPTTLKAIRHYELLNLSRRPRPEAAEFERLVETYSAPDSTTRTIKVAPVSVEIQAAPVTVPIHITNTSDHPVHLTVTGEGPAGLTVAATLPQINLNPSETASIPVQLTLSSNSLPGFYHCFLRLEDPATHTLRYAWIQARHPGQPHFTTPSPLDFTQPTAIVYGDDCPPLELEAAWVIYQTLESATGVPTQIFTASELPKTGLTNLIYVGTPKSLPAGIHTDPANHILTITASTSAAVASAAMDFTLSYWPSAKDAACRRIPMTAQPISKGPDAGQLP